MSRCEALNLFNVVLNKNGEYTLLNDFTEDEFKKAWHFIAKKCHPDSKGGSTIYFQKLKEAKEILEKSICKKKRVVEPIKKEKKTCDVLQKIKENTINKMNAFLSENVSSEIQVYLKKLKKDIFYRIIKINQLNSEIEIKDEYDQFLNQVYMVYNEMKKDYFYKHFIIEESVKESLRYDCNIENFYHQLMNLKQQYGFKNSLDALIQNYYSKESFTFLKDRIERMIEVCRESLRCSLSKEIIIDNFEKGLEDLFSRYDKIENRLRVLKEDKINSIQMQEIELLEMSMYETPLEKIEEKLFVLEKQVQNPFVKRDLYIKVKDVKEEEKGSIFLVINIKDDNCLLLEWQSCKDTRPFIQEVSKAYILSHFILLENYFISENKVFKSWYGNDLLYTFGNFLLFMMGEQIGVDRKENYLSSPDLSVISEDKYPLRDIKMAIIKQISLDLKKKNETQKNCM